MPRYRVSFNTAIVFSNKAYALNFLNSITAARDSALLRGECEINTSIFEELKDIINEDDAINSLWDSPV